MNSKYSLLLLLLASSLSYSQKLDLDAVAPNNEWWEGSIMLNDGVELEGLVKYDDNSDFLSYQNGNDQRSFTSRSVMGFEFFDESLNKQRVFYALPYIDPKSNLERPLFFEVIKDLKNFAVISRVAPIEIEYGSNYNTTPQSGFSSPNLLKGTPTQVTQMSTRSITVSHSETIYFLNTETKIEPFIVVTKKEVSHILYKRNKTKSKVLDSSLIKKYFLEPGFTKMMAYLEENDL